jgi:isoleucyl-tRNA synthetase
MGAKLKNKYFILRHGESTHQTERPNLVYYWPEDKPPASLTRVGRGQIEEKVKQLKDKKIDLIFSSDVLRTRQTANIVAQELGLKVQYDKRLRDIDWGVFQGKTAKEAWGFFGHNMEERFEKPPPEGESWLDVKRRMTSFIEDIDKKYSKKNILIISHGDPLWLLDSWARGLDNKEALKERGPGCPIKLGDLRKLN